MRRLLYVVLILLLPLRGWVGDAMATQMAFPAAVQHATSGPVQHGAHAGSPAQAHLLSAAVQHAGDGCAGHADLGLGDAAQCETCAMCQTCHTVAVLHPVPNQDVGPAIASLPQRAAHGFTSADRALVLKPPTA